MKRGKKISLIVPIIVIILGILVYHLLPEIPIGKITILPAGLGSLMFIFGLVFILIFSVDTIGK